MATIRNQIGVYLQTTVSGIVGLTAYRPKRIAWNDALTAGGSAVVRQAGRETLHVGSGVALYRQHYAITIRAVNSDDSTASIETLLGEWVAEVLKALAADDTCGGLAMAGGLTIASVTSLDSDTGSGMTIAVSVTYSCQTADASAPGVRS